MKKTLFFVLLIFIPSLVLGIHNATLYNPKHGFDGSGHVFYIEYLNKNKTLPAPLLNWETHQPPIYYLVGAALMYLGKTWKSAQYLNTFVLWLLIGMVGLGLRKVFKKADQVLLGMLALAGLPMLNIFPAMITNELLSTFWIISTVTALLFMLEEKKGDKIIPYLFWFTVSFILGAWTKVSIFTILPTIITGFVLLLSKNKNSLKPYIFMILLVVSVIGIFYYPLFMRSSNSPSGLVNLSTTYEIKRSADFYYRLDWIPKTDMYNTQYYSFIGGAWNSFWTDGHNAVTPFVKFHKKSFILWSLGFILLPLSLYGLVQLLRKNRRVGLYICVLGINMLLVYLYYNISSDHYSAVRLTYEMGIVLTYAFGIAGASLNKKLNPFILIILLIQFIVMLSFFWIQPWWHVTK